jgi:5'-3' exonuclease
MKMILSDGAVPGEGEHKFLDLIRKMRVQKKYKNDVIYIYGKDADLIVLAVSTQKSNIHIMREVQSESDYELKKMYESYEFLDLNIDNLRIGFNDEITKSFPGNHGFNKMRILNDYIFLTFLVGNDFVMSMPFLKVRKDGLKTLIAIYHDIKLNHEDYLVLYDQDIKNDIPKINISFLQELFLEISKKEDFLMKKQQEEVNRLMRGGVQDRRMTAEAMMTPNEIYESRYIHLEVCHPQHPMYSKYFEDFMKIDYKKNYEAWKELYYNTYLGVNKTDMESYERVRMNCVKNYLESLMFSLKYYFCGVPSWTWHYKFRVSPLPSDVYHALKSDIFNPNDFVFHLGEPYTPFQQLMLILPPQMNGLVPSVFRPIMNDDKLLCTQFYPVDFRIDASVGIKTQYSEAILPEIDDELLINTVKEHEKDLTASEKERNKIREKPLGT